MGIAAVARSNVMIPVVNLDYCGHCHCDVMRTYLMHRILTPYVGVAEIWGPKSSVKGPPTGPFSFLEALILTNPCRTTICLSLSRLFGSPLLW